MSVHFIFTGGTIDSYYDTDECTAKPLNQSSIPDYLRATVTADCSKYEFSEICMKDSRDINMNDRERMIDIISNSQNNKFIITHGTFTLFETAKYLEEHLKRKDITVVLTGALIPLKGFAPTDADFNLGYSLAVADNIGSGIYVCIKGETYSSDSPISLHQ